MKEMGRLRRGCGTAHTYRPAQDHDEGNGDGDGDADDAIHVPSDQMAAATVNSSIRCRQYNTLQYSMVLQIVTEWIYE